MTPDEIDRLLRQVLLKDMRTQCRLRCLSPAGGKEQLSDRLKEHMLATGDFSLKNENGDDLVVTGIAGTSSTDVAKGFAQNNYMRPSGQQNVGNFITDRASSRVLAPPGGVTSIVFGDASNPCPNISIPSPRQRHQVPLSPQAKAGIAAGIPTPPPGSLSAGANQKADNNYARPAGQNVGNFLTDKRSTKVAGCTPGGSSQIIFG